MVSALPSASRPNSDHAAQARAANLAVPIQRFLRESGLAANKLDAATPPLQDLSSTYLPSLQMGVRRWERMAR